MPPLVLTVIAILIPALAGAFIVLLTVILTVTGIYVRFS